MIGRSRMEAFSLRASRKGRPRESLGLCSHTILLQMPLPHFVTSIFAEPSSLAQMPVGSAAKASEDRPAAARATVRTTGAIKRCCIEHLLLPCSAKRSNRPSATKLRPRFLTRPL